MPDISLGLACVLLLILGAEFVNGWTDAPNAIATVIGTRALSPRAARVVELRYFAGLSIEETADTLGTSPATVKRDFSLARAWLFRELSGPPLFGS